MERWLGSWDWKLRPTLHNAPAKQNQADRTDQAEDKVAEVVDDGNGVACGKGGHAMLMVSVRARTAIT